MSYSTMIEQEGHHQNTEWIVERCQSFRVVFVDASGQNGLLMNRLNLRIWDPVLNKGAIWTYWEGAYRDTGRDEGATMVLQTVTRNGWFWYIPLHNNVVSVGVVAPFDYLFKGKRIMDRRTEKRSRRCPAVQERVSKAKQGHRLFCYERLLLYRYGGRRGSSREWQHESLTRSLVSCHSSST